MKKWFAFGIPLEVFSTVFISLCIFHYKIYEKHRFLNANYQTMNYYFIKSVNCGYCDADDDQSID